MQLYSDIQCKTNTNLHAQNILHNIMQLIAMCKSLNVSKKRYEHGYKGIYLNATSWNQSHLHMPHIKDDSLSNTR